MAAERPTAQESRGTSAPGRAFSTRRQRIVLFVWGLVLAIAFVVLTAVVWETNRPVRLDRAAAELGLTGETGPLGGHPRLARMAERLGSRTGVGVATAVLLGVAVVWRDAVAGVAALLAPLASFVVTEYLAKPLINEPVPFGGRAYPSGHAAGIAAVAVSALVLFYRRWGGLGSVLVAPLAVVAVLTVALGVLALEFHYPTDVAGGVALGGTAALWLTALFDVSVNVWSKRPSRAARGTQKQPTA